MGHQLASQLTEPAVIQDERVVSPEQSEFARAVGRLLPRRTPDQFGHPGGAFDVGNGRLVVAIGLDPIDYFAE